MTFTHKQYTADKKICNILADMVYLSIKRTYYDSKLMNVIDQKKTDTLDEMFVSNQTFLDGPGKLNQTLKITSAEIKNFITTLIGNYLYQCYNKEQDDLVKIVTFMRRHIGSLGGITGLWKPKSKDKGYMKSEYENIVEELCRDDSCKFKGLVIDDMTKLKSEYLNIMAFLTYFIKCGYITGKKPSAQPVVVQVVEAIMNFLMCSKYPELEEAEEIFISIYEASKTKKETKKKTAAKETSDGPAFNIE